MLLSQSLDQESQTRGPRPACGPPDVFVRPATSLKLLKLLLKLLFFLQYKGTFSLLLWPAYETEFETPGLYHDVIWNRTLFHYILHTISKLNLIWNISKQSYLQTLTCRKKKLDQKVRNDCPRYRFDCRQATAARS